MSNKRLIVSRDGLLIPLEPLLSKTHSVLTDEEWQENMKEVWWHSSRPISYLLEKDPRVKIDYAEKIDTLRNKLYSLCNGSEVCLPPIEEDIDAINDRGQFWHGKGIRMMKGKPSQCHRNTCELWENNYKEIDIHIATGYALSDDGMWRQHSWLVINKTCSTTIVETTVKRIGYYGFLMTEEEALKFCGDNY